MAGRYNQNPFGQDSVNPFSDLEKKERQLQAKDKELRKREEELRLKEETAARGANLTEKKNWPPCFPIIHHDIANDIPIHLRSLQYTAFATLLGLVLCLFWNATAVTVSWIKLRYEDTMEGVNVWFLSIIYVIAGVPLAYILWYRTLYRSFRHETAMRFGCFFLFYSIHICYCIFAAIAPPIFYSGYMFCGMMSALEMIRLSYLVGIIYFVGFGLFCLEAVLSMYVIQQVLVYFRGIGKAADAKREAAIIV